MSHWTPQEESTMIKMVQTDYPVNAIAARLGRSTGSVHSRLKRMDEREQVQQQQTTVEAMR